MLLAICCVYIQYMGDATYLHNSAGALEAVLQHPAVWRAARAPLSSAPVKALGTGYTQLDQLLPEGGWPAAELVEFLCPQWGIGEIQLLCTTLARLSQQERWIVLVAPPWIPYAPALSDYGIDLDKLIIVRARAAQEQLWALEQSLASGACSAVLGWPEAIQSGQVRRLQLAAQKGGGLGVILRPAEQQQQASPAPLRIELGLPDAELRVRIVKCRGGWGSSWLRLPWRASHLPSVSDDAQSQSVPVPGATAVHAWQRGGAAGDAGRIHPRPVGLGHAGSSPDATAQAVQGGGLKAVAGPAASRRPG